MEYETYSLETLRVICTQRRDSHGDRWTVKQLLPWHDLRDDGLWLAPVEPFTTGEEEDLMRWHPRGDESLPALPSPFTALDLAALFLDGGGAFLREMKPYRWQVNASEARRAFTSARWWCRRAEKRFAPTSEGHSLAAAWLLSQQEAVEGGNVSTASDVAVPVTPGGTGKRRTDAELAALAAYRDEHGATAAAKKFGISTARIRQLLPREKSKPKGFSVFSQPSK